MGIGSVRINNINRVHKIWLLRLGNKDLQEISKISLSKKDFVDFVIKNTSSDWFKRPIKKASYFDTNAYWIKKNELKKQQIQKLNKSLEKHKKFLNYVLMTNIVIIILIVLI